MLYYRWLFFRKLYEGIRNPRPNKFCEVLRDFSEKSAGNPMVFRLFSWQKRLKISKKCNIHCPVEMDSIIREVVKWTRR